MRYKKLKQLIPYFIVFILILIYFKNESNKYNNELNHFNSQLDLAAKRENFNYEISLKLKSFCSQCRPDLYIKKFNLKSNPNINLYHTNDDVKNIFYFSNGINEKLLDTSLISDRNIYKNPKFTCDLYNVFKHGPNQKVLSYCLYGRHYPYYNYIGKIVRTAKHIYPGWIIRVYYDNSINKSIICDLECKYENIYFCNVNQLPINYQEDVFKLISHKQENRIYQDYAYVHAMMWRWFPIADDFIDYFGSRDTDSTLIQREKDSVDVWLKEEKLFHIMRDNPYHNTVILGGLWGHANVLNRTSGYQIYNDFISENTQKEFNPTKNHLKNNDQNYLTIRVWGKALLNATIHDSYNCMTFGGKPFPTRRPTNMYCFVSCFNPCCNLIHNQTQRMPMCPVQCRPIDHQDWETC